MHKSIGVFVFANNVNDNTKTHDSVSRGQEEAAIIHKTKSMQLLIELFTRKNVQQIAKAIAKTA